MPNTLKPLTIVELARFRAWIAELPRERQPGALFVLSELVDACRFAGADVDLDAVEQMTAGLRRSLPRRPVAVPVVIAESPRSIARRRARAEAARREAEEPRRTIFYAPQKI